MTSDWWRIEWNRACFAVVVEADRVVETAPIANWMRGRPWQALLGYLRQRGARVQKLRDLDPPEGGVASALGEPHA